MVVLIGVWAMAGTLVAQEHTVPPLAFGHRAVPEAAGEAVLRSFDEHHVLLAVDGSQGGLFSIETESALDSPIHLRSKRCEVYHFTGDRLVAVFDDEGKEYVFALKGGSTNRGRSDAIASGSRRLAVTLVADAISVTYQQGAPINLDDFEGGFASAGPESIKAEGNILPYNQNPGPNAGSGGCKSSCSATRHNPIPFIGADTCSVECVPPNCASCSEDSAGVSCYCYLPH